MLNKYQELMFKILYSKEKVLKKKDQNAIQPKSKSS